MQRILLPLDGSELSEVAIPLAETVARAQHAEVTAVRVVPPPTQFLAQNEGYMPPDAYDDLLRSLQEEAEAYLAQIAERLQADGISVRTEWRDGLPSSTLLDCEGELRPDLVVMATHGRSGLARFALGSIADRMVREGSVPVLLARSFSPAVAELETALVPLDGSSVAEAALPIVEDLASNPLRSVQLLRAVAEPDEEPAARAYLRGVAQRLSSKGLQTAVVVAVDHASHAVAQAAQQVNLVILSTHGRGGFDRLRHGSIAERATRMLATPTLLVRAGAASSQGLASDEQGPAR
jgi:nucleotide-binding universal stress UspA family protein